MLADLYPPIALPLTRGAGQEGQLLHYPRVKRNPEDEDQILFMVGAPGACLLPIPLSAAMQPGAGCQQPCSWILGMQPGLPCCAQPPGLCRDHTRRHTNPPALPCVWIRAVQGNRDSEIAGVVEKIQVCNSWVYIVDEVLKPTVDVE